MSLDSINKKTSKRPDTLPWTMHIIIVVQFAKRSLHLRSKGGRANFRDENGDLNVERHAVVMGSDIEVVRKALTKVDNINVNE